MVDFEIIWDRIVYFQGEEFRTKTNLSFTYTINNNVLNPSRTEFNLSKENFQKAYLDLPVKNVSDFSDDVMGPSYVWGIFNDERILG